MKTSFLKTLVIVSPGFPANEDDTSCLPPRQTFIKALKQDYPNLNIIVLSLQYPFRTDEYLWHGVKVFSFGAENQNQFFRWLTFFKVYLKLRSLHKEYELIGLLSFWLNKAAFIAHYFAKFNQLKHFCWLLGQDAKKGNKYVNYIKPEENSLIALSDFIAREFKKNYHITPRHIIPVGIDKTQFLPLFLTKEIDVLGVGSFIPLKQYDVFLEIVKQVVVEFPHLKAVICGDGSEMKRLQELIIQFNLSENVALVGRLPHAEVLILMQQAKIFLHPSNYEGFGSVNLEALCGGAKVVSFVKPMDIPIQNWNHVNDINAAATKIKTILADRSISYQSILPFPISTIAKSILALYDYNELAIS